MCFEWYNSDVMMLLLSNHIEKYMVALRVRVSVCKDKNLPRLCNLKIFVVRHH